MSSIIADVEVAFRPSNHDFSKRWLDYNPSTKVLPKGWVKEPGRRQLPCDIVFEKDFAITLRDGSVIFADCFRPVSSSQEPVPALLAWSPYGKEGNGFQSLDRVPFRCGIPKSWTSDLEKFEAPDPAEWCPRGYAIINVDPRGVFDSDGDIFVFGSQEGRDGYDTVEAIGTKDWCNGAVGLVGNSWLAVAQWFIAAERPPHLKAIAPWEGFSDMYRETICRGGIPNTSFWNYRSQGYCGKNSLEDFSAMLHKYPFRNAYWDDKRAKLQQIEIPIYCLASFSSELHTEGSLRGFLFSSTTEKWLRLHHTQEWHDLYQPSSNNDLQLFFDKYLRDMNNGWEKTPRVRHSLLGYNCEPVINRPERTYPPEYVEHQTFFLNGANGSLETDGPDSQTCQTTYQSDSWDDDGAHFKLAFSKYTELIGYSRVTLYMSCADTDDMDVYVIIRKLDANGRALLHLNIPIECLPEGVSEKDVPDLNVFKYVGPNGRLRASHRKIGSDPDLTSDQTSAIYPADVWHPHDAEEKLPLGQVACLEIPLWPGGVIFQPGESLRLEVKGHAPTLPEFPALHRAPQNLNKGRHIIHTGPEYPSSVILPLTKA